MVIDNTVALSALVHGYSGKADLAKMANAFFLQMAGLPTLWKVVAASRCHPHMYDAARDQ